jgi:protein translocase SecG subunit
MFLFWLIFILFAVSSVLLTAIILMQEPKQGGLGEGLGSGGGMDFTNVRGTAGGLHRLTIYVGIVWGILALLLAIVPRA